MSDSDSRPSIPSWQRQHPASSPPTSDGNATDNDDRSTLLEQASNFLQDDSIRDAPTDQKITFLESKGLTATEIDSLLGVSRNPEANSSDSSAEENKSAPTPSTGADSKASLEQDVTANTPSSDTRPADSAPRDVPPIITYPEFLLHQSKPPPLVTLRSVLYTLYGAAGLSAAAYGASEYLVKPMISALTDARLDLAHTTEENLKKLNEKLEQNVSQLPPSLTAKLTTSTGHSEEDIESITSDPTELFHRDIGTQTSHDLIQTPSTTSTSTVAETTSNDPTVAVTTHQKRLETIGAHLRELEDAQSQSSTLHDTTRSRISDLHHYLDRLMYAKNSHLYSSLSYGGYSTPGIDTGAAATGVGKAEEDAIAGFRAEIRGVKGALLSARNFPSGRSAGLRSSYVR
ncbi:peroxisomal membrane protein PEX14 [Aspergillus mulundensis]|uniref:Peroxisomal membrane protein PEX14 n=1 Tax=Aspergillus mulundensis TaxID=1810919 RepID=A0A3D8SVK6_9EURO|nr:putative microbody (Peroxisome) biogenesis protein peroxin 14 [Aspergillus mulundensis]RDW90326.1 putative microbody (Peroxisome) biogenesis protein peroxin 14 [Aspergillus mulundensis]